MEEAYKERGTAEDSVKQALSKEKAAIEISNAASLSLKRAACEMEDAEKTVQTLMSKEKQAIIDAQHAESWTNVPKQEEMPSGNKEALSRTSHAQQADERRRQVVAEQGEALRQIAAARKANVEGVAASSSDANHRDPDDHRWMQNIISLRQMGFTENDAKQALQDAHGDGNMAAIILISRASHM